MELLKNKVAVITGGTRGIGLETAKVFLENGARVVIFGSREESVGKALAELAGEGGVDGVSATDEPDGASRVGGYWPDLSDFEAIEKVMTKIAAKYGRIDILVNNAGRAAQGPIENTSTEDFEALMDLNCTAMFRTIKAVVPLMKEQGGGVILNTSSMVGTYGQPSGVGYPASKFAVNGLTKSLARELAPAGIRVNAVAPGVINTDMMAAVPKEMIEPLLRTIPLGRIGEPREVANAFLFLASDLASYVTGEIMAVDGAARS